MFVGHYHKERLQDSIITVYMINSSVYEENAIVFINLLYRIHQGQEFVIETEAHIAIYNYCAKIATAALD